MGQTIKNAAEIAGINYENAKAVTRIYKREARTDAKKFRLRPKKGEDINTLIARKQLGLTSSQIPEPMPHQQVAS